MAAGGPSDHVTELLRRWGEGEQDALPRLIEAVHRELRAMARRQFAREGPRTLQPTALVNELYMRLVRQRKVGFQNREQFFAVAGAIMRRILVDQARRRKARRRELHVTLGAADGHAEVQADAGALDDALARLEAEHPREYRVVELRYFAGLGIEEVARALDVGTGTVKRDWRFARAWLFHELGGPALADRGTGGHRDSRRYGGHLRPRGRPGEPGPRSGSAAMRRQIPWSALF